MADFVDDDVIYDLMRSHDELPVEVEVILPGAASPDTGNLLEDDPVIGNSQ